MVLQSPTAQVTAILEVSEAGLSGAQKVIESLGGKVRTAVAETGTVTFEITAHHLPEVADAEGVVYVNTATPMQNPE